MSAIDIHRWEIERHDDELRTAVLLGAGTALLGGTLWWAWNRSRPHRRQAPGRPGAAPRWNFAAKDAVGTAPGPASRVWFTVCHGVFSEIFYPRVDQPAIRDLGLVVTDGRGFFSDEAWDAGHEVSWVAPGVPAYRLINTCLRGRYRIEKTVLAHPCHDAVLQHARFQPLAGTMEDFRLFVLVSPHLGNQGAENTAWIGDYKGIRMLFAQRGDRALALAGSLPWAASSAGFVGSISDGRRSLKRHGRLIRTYDRAEDGNVALTGEVDLRASGGAFVLALGFGGSPTEAAYHARASLADDFDAIQDEYTKGWRKWQQTPAVVGPAGQNGHELYAVSTAVLRAHEDKTIPGAIVASLSNPWGQVRDDGKSGPVGYHVVWPRDLTEVAGALIAVGAKDDAVRALRYLQVTQEADGHWPQNQWIDGIKAWDSIQIGETAQPVLLVSLLSREGGLTAEELASYWPMVRAAAGFILRTGPSSQEDRWEDARGFTPFTLAVQISALLAAAQLADAHDEPGLAVYLRESADTWNDSVEFWTYVEDTELAHRVGVKGYYLRIAPPDGRGEPSKGDGTLEFRYRRTTDSAHPPAQVVSPDALAYVRFGLRAPDDPRILNTVKVIDALLKVETPFGPAWHRYSFDGYGEQHDGSPFDGKRGIGRAWPLLVGERAHYELAAGHRDEAVRLLRAMESFAGDGGMIPEQVWDTEDIPERGLYLGRPTGSAMPLAWAHAEYLKLCRSLSDGRVFDMPQQAAQRYLVDKVESPFVIWRPNHRRRTLPGGKTLRVELLEHATLCWNVDGRTDGDRIRTRDTGLGVHVADVPTGGLPAGSEIQFTLTGLEDSRSEKKNGETKKSSVVRVL